MHSRFIKTPSLSLEYSKIRNIHFLHNFQIHQYQVTEPTNDHTVRDPITGKQTFYAPDPDPSLPVYKISPSTDPFSQPSNSRPVSYDISFSNSNEPSAAALVQPQQSFIQLAQTVPQQQLPDSYGLPLSNQPQLQQHFLQQQQPSIYQAQPLSVYNPTYLVTQSNQLLNQHKQRLFNPDPNYLQQQSQHLEPVAGDSEFLPSFNIQSVASAGQIFTAAQDTAKNNKKLAEAQNDYNVQSSSRDSPQFAALVSPRNPNIYAANQYNEQQSLSEQEVSNLLNYGRIEGHGSEPEQQNFIASTFFQAAEQDQPSSDGNLYDVVQHHQQQNEDRINQATQAFIDQSTYSTKPGTIYVTAPPEQRQTEAQYAHQEHQQRLAEQFNGSDLRIFVPDVEYHTELVIVYSY